jgi:arylsulfatase A-like enzyme
MNKYLLVIIFALSLGVVVLFFTSRVKENESKKDISTKRWNVILIQADTLRADRLGCYGRTSAHTPNLDALASEGVLFENHIVNSTYTACSVPSMLTGNYQDKHGLWYHGDILSGNNITLPERLSALGYQTAGISANPVVDVERGYAQGLDTMLTLKGNPPAAKMVGHAIKWLDQNGDDPFFLWLLLIDPHFPYIPPEQFAQLFPKSEPFQESFSWQISFAHGDVTWDKESLMWGKVANEKQIEQESALYEGEIAYLDSQIGVLLDHLDKQGLRDNTLIVFTSDHGEELGEHTFFCSHGHSTYDTLARVPLIIRTPNNTPLRVPQVVRTIDIAPTILNLLDIPFDNDIDGRSLAPLIRGDEIALPLLPAYIANGPIHEGFWRETPRIYVKGVEGTWASLRTEKWKLIRIPHPQNDIFELYDIENDPEEKYNIYESNLPQATRLITMLDAVKDRIPIEERTNPEQQGQEIDTLEMLESLGYLGNLP